MSEAKDCKDCNNGKWIAKGCECPKCGRRVPGRHEGLMAQMRQADWDGLERDVVMRIRLLRGLTEKLTGDPRTADLIARDLIDPNVELLARFCVNIEIENEDEDEDEDEKKG